MNKFQLIIIRLFLTVLLILSGTSFSLAYNNITVKGTATSPNLETARKEATFNARKALLAENKKMILAWTSRYYSDTGFNFEEVARKVSLKASAVISREKVKKRKDTYTVTVYISYGTNSRQITSELLDAFERNLYPPEKAQIHYYRDNAFKELYEIIKRW